jgi:uncharacterized membrane protein
MKTKRMIASIVEIILGFALWICSAIGMIDSYWGGMGGGLMGVGIVFLIRSIRYKRDPEYKEEYDVEMNDERNKFIRLKAWSWAGYMYMMIAAVGSIVFKLMGREDLMFFCSGSVCLVLVLYLISYVIVKNKY